jgi:GT2 family glycosyltransferase
MTQVSVVIPLYNKGRYLRRALDSVCTQTFGDFEIIVVDDGSTDDGPEIVQHLSDPRIRLVHQVNAGPGAARNRGVKEAQAAWVAFLDADDEWLPDFLRVSLDALETHPECEVSVASRFEGPSRTDVTPGLGDLGLRTGMWSLPPHADVAALTRGRAPFCIGAVVCRRDIFEKYGGFYDRTRVVCGEDTYLWLQLLVNCKIFMILRPLAWYHCEASDLGRRMTKPGVLQPYYSDPEGIRRNCPREHRSVLDEYLTTSAARRVSELCLHRDTKTAKELLDAFSALRHPASRYAGLRMKLLFPGIYRTLWQARAALGGRSKLRQARAFLHAPE